MQKYKNKACCIYFCAAIYFCYCAAIIILFFPFFCCTIGTPRGVVLPTCLKMAALSSGEKMSLKCPECEKEEFVSDSCAAEDMLVRFISLLK